MSKARVVIYSRLYERKFTKLSRYVEVLVATEADRYQMFEKGLR